MNLIRNFIEQSTSTSFDYSQRKKRKKSFTSSDLVAPVDEVLLSASCTLVGTTTCRRPAAGGRVDALLPGGVPAPVLYSTSWMADGRRRLGRTRRRGFLDGEFAGERTEGESSRPLEIGFVRLASLVRERMKEKRTVHFT
jgi:hypothetical protein